MIVYKNKGLVFGGVLDDEGETELGGVGYKVNRIDLYTKKSIFIALVCF